MPWDRLDPGPLCGSRVAGQQRPQRPGRLLCLGGHRPLRHLPDLDRRLPGFFPRPPVHDPQRRLPGGRTVSPGDCHLGLRISPHAPGGGAWGCGGLLRVRHRCARWRGRLHRLLPGRSPAPPFGAPTENLPRRQHRQHPAPALRPGLARHLGGSPASHHADYRYGHRAGAPSQRRAHLGRSEGMVRLLGDGPQHDGHPDGDYCGPVGELGAGHRGRGDLRKQTDGELPHPRGHPHLPPYGAARGGRDVHLGHGNILHALWLSPGRDPPGHPRRRLFGPWSSPDDGRHPPGFRPGGPPCSQPARRRLSQTRCELSADGHSGLWHSGGGLGNNLGVRLAGDP